VLLFVVACRLPPPRLGSLPCFHPTPSSSLTSIPRSVLQKRALSIATRGESYARSEHSGTLSPHAPAVQEEEEEEGSSEGDEHKGGRNEVRVCVV
jgi:hypothetical protein